MQNLILYASACRHRFTLPRHLCNSLSSSKSSLPDDAELGHMHKMPHMGHESVALDKLLSLPERSALGGLPLLLWDDEHTLEPHCELQSSPPSQPSFQDFLQSSSWLDCPKDSPSNCSMSHSRSCESLCSTRHLPSTSVCTRDRKLPIRLNSMGEDGVRFIRPTMKLIRIISSNKLLLVVAIYGNTRHNWTS